MTAMSTKQRKPGWWYPWIFVAAFMVVVGVNGIMAFIATDSFTGLATENHYKQGIEYNAVLDAARAQEQLGWAVDIAFDGDRAGTGHAGRLHVSFLDKDGRPIDGLQVKARVVRPVQEGYDRDVPLGPAESGAYAADIDFALPGQWEVRVIAFMDDGTSYQKVRRIMVP